MTLGDKIQELRKINKMSQEKMAELLGVSRQAVSKWETGLSNPNTENLISLAKILNVPIEQLTHPNTRFELVLDVRKEIGNMKKGSKTWKYAVGCFLLLFIGTFSAALYTRFNSGYSETIVFNLVLVSAGFMLLAFLPIISTILRFVYHDCKKRGIKPTFWVAISTTLIGLLYYILNRDYIVDGSSNKQ